MDGLTADTVTYTSLIDACGKAGDAELATTIFKRMRSNGIKPHVISYSALARPFAHKGDWETVESIAADMVADGITPNEYFVYARLLSYALARPRQDDHGDASARPAGRHRIAQLGDRPVAVDEPHQEQSDARQHTAV